MVAFRSPKPSVRVRIFLLLLEIEVWCNGSTLDFGSNSSGSNPDTSTTMCLWASGRNHWSAKPIIHRWFESNQALKCLCGVMNSTKRYGRFREGLNPSRDTRKVCYI